MYILAQETVPRKQLFDNDWKFNLGDVKNGSSFEFDDQNWRNIDLPHDWSIEGRISPKNPTGGDGGFFPSGTGWYRKTFVAPSNWRGRLVSINFEGVYMNSEVFINGKSLGTYPYGYSAFTYDLSPYLNFGKQNVIAVRVDNSKQKNSRWYSGSGIYRHVWMVVTDQVHIANFGVGITTPKVDEKKATVQLKTLVKNETGLPRMVIVQTNLLDSRLKKSGTAQTRVRLEAHSEKEVLQVVQVEKPSLWSPKKPHLYRAKIEVIVDRKVIDDNKTDFGIRSLKFTTTNGFQLNGQTLKLNGGCVHHDNGCLGAAAYDRAEQRRVELLIAAGFNAIRTSHNPPSEAFLDACDRLGMLVIDEAFDGWKTAKNKYDYAMYFDEWWKKDLDAMVLRDRNHPSVIMWSTGNEIIERKEPQAVHTAKMLVDAVHKIDPSRPVTSAMTTWDKDWEIFDPLMAQHDVSGYNYQLHRAVADHQRVPSRVIVQTESYPRDAFANWKLVNNNSYIIGDFVWTALDYLGESGIGRWYYSGEAANFHSSSELFPWHGAYCGDIDLIGWRKPISHYRSMLYNDTEKLYLAVREPNPEPLEIKETDWSVWPTWENWTWPEYDGKPLQVEVYAKYPKVRLYLNKKLIGEKETTEVQEFKAVFTVPYAAGELVAVGVQDNKEVETASLKTAANAAKLKLTADRSEISADGQDLVFVTVELTDKDGTLQPNAENRINFELDGPGQIIGLDNANLKDVDPYISNSRRAWKGRALVAVKSSKKAGTIRLKASASGLAAAVVVIRSSQK
jgi:beta-galactosidase